jgi:hypothetical protein
MAAVYVGEADRLRKERRTVLIGAIDRFTPKHRELFVHTATLGEAETHLRRVLAARGRKLRKKQ